HGRQQPAQPEVVQPDAPLQADDRLVAADQLRGRPGVAGADAADEVGKGFLVSHGPAHAGKALLPGPDCTGGGAAVSTKYSGPRSEGGQDSGNFVSPAARNGSKLHGRTIQGAS